MESCKQKVRFILAIWRIHIRLIKGRIFLETYYHIDSIIDMFKLESSKHSQRYLRGFDFLYIRYIIRMWFLKYFDDLCFVSTPIFLELIQSLIECNFVHVWYVWLSGHWLLCGDFKNVSIMLLADIFAVMYNCVWNDNHILLFNSEPYISQRSNISNNTSMLTHRS